MTATTMTISDLVALGSRINDASEKVLNDSKILAADERWDEATVLAAKAQGMLETSRMLLDAITDLKPIETVGEFAQRAATELGNWSEVCRHVEIGRAHV